MNNWIKALLIVLGFELLIVGLGVTATYAPLQLTIGLGVTAVTFWATCLVKAVVFN